MVAQKRFCEQCGSPLKAGARFCEMCGSPAESAAPAPAEGVESVAGHVPAERLEEGKNLFGHQKTTQLELVITTLRILCLRQTEDMNDAWLAEQDGLEEEEKLSGTPWRTLIDRYDWRGPVWAAFYETPPRELLSSDRGNGAIPLSEIVRATVTLNDEMDGLDIELGGGQVFRFWLYNLTGKAAARFLTEVLGRDRVRLAGPVAP
jgi:hypothetical protein